MKTIKTLVLSLAIVIIATGTSSCQKTKKTTDGIEYTYIKEGKDNPKKGEFVIYHLNVSTDKDSTFISTLTDGVPAYLIYDDSIPKKTGMDEIFLSLRKGDSIAIKAPALKIFGENVPYFLKGDQDIKIQIGVIDVLDEKGAQAYFTQIQEDQAKKEGELSKKQLETDIKLIEEYVAKNKLVANRTESGLFYVIEKEGEGAQIQPGNTAFVHYAGFLLDGTIFDTSNKELAKANNVYNDQRDAMGGYAPLDVQVGVGAVIPGWDEGLALLKKGSKAKLLIPSPLAYGNRQSGAVIQPNSVLVFDVEITDVK
jgi:FKBP-type peptidyl-prolyl cis-trans isomerase FkpA